MKIDKDSFGVLAICAIRYCHGRETYMPGLVREKVRPHIKEITDRDLGVMIADCDFQRTADLYGNERIDKPGWLEWEKTLLAEKERRKGWLNQ